MKIKLQIDLIIVKFNKYKHEFIICMNYISRWKFNNHKF